MTIAILSRYYGKVERGSETWAKNLKEKLKHEVEIISGNQFWAIGKWLGSDVIIPTNGRLQVFLCRLLTYLKGKPMIVFGHAGPGADDKWNLLCSPDVFVAFSRAQKKWAERYKLPWTKVVVIPHAVDVKRFTPAERKPKKKMVLCVAANIPGKRINLVKKAVEKLAGYKLLVVGKGNPLEASFDKMPEIYRKADVFCLVPWEREAFGLVFLEALASNLPVVTTDDEVRREIVGGGGIFVKDPKDTNLLAAAIKKAYETKWEDKPRKQAEKFSWDKIITKYEKLFSSCSNH